MGRVGKAIGVGLVGTPVGAALSRLLTVTGSADTTKKDAVKVTVTRR